MNRLILLAVILACAGCSAPDADMTIVVIPKGLTHEHWQSVHRGALRAAADLEREEGLKVRIVWDGPLRERDMLAQIRIVDRRISAGVNGIVLAPQHSQTMCPPAQRAVEQGIPVVVIDSGLERTDLIAKYVATDNYRGGYLAADHLLKVLAADSKRKTRNIVLLRYQIGSESTERREAGFEKRIEEEIARQKPGDPPIVWLNRDKYAGATRDSARREAGPLIHQFVNSDGSCQIDGFFAPNESSASGVLDELKALGLNKKVHLMGFDSSQPLLQAVEDGNVDGLILQDPYRMGYMGVWAVVKRLQGYDIHPKDFLSTGEFVITKENVNAPETVALFDAEAQSKRPSAGNSPTALRKDVHWSKP
jgi:ribose transport system substrate-binding protein